MTMGPAAVSGLSMFGQLGKAGGGHWQPAVNVASAANALKGKFRDATLLSAACIKGHACTAVGWYVDTSNRQQAMVATGSAP
jgi:hypothetical protein